VRLRAAGDAAILVELDHPDEVLPFAAAVGRAPHPALTDVVPAERSVLVRFADAARAGSDPRPEIARRLRELRPHRAGATPGPRIEIPVVYDGEDLPEVARRTGLDPAGVIAAHTGQEWVVAFTGFAPGFGYLRGDDRLRVPRRDEPRARVPAGAVALAAGYSGVYPRVSPGGWQLIGRTDLPLWDETRTPPALLAPGTRVVFTPAPGRRPGTRPARSRPRPSRPGRPALEVLDPGFLTTVQDLGRPGWAHVGVGTSGAADRSALRLANRLVGNREGAAGLEVTLGGLVVRVVDDLLAAVTGASVPVLVDDRPVPRNAVLQLFSGSVLRLGTATAGVRAVLAVRGGLAGAVVLGSRATDVLSGLGPPRLERGQVLEVGSDRRAWPVLDVAPVADPPTATVRLVAMPGPRDGALGPGGAALLAGTTWRVSERSDRVGVRLDGPALPVDPDAAEGPSEGVVRGAVQLPPGGRPVLFLADHPVTGGYPVIAVLPEADVDRVAQLRPGQGVRLVLDDTSSSLIV
jgi:KipI family sensor histidine kinase inhibitor